MLPRMTLLNANLASAGASSVRVPSSTQYLLPALSKIFLHTRGPLRPLTPLTPNYASPAVRCVSPDTGLVPLTARLVPTIITSRLPWQLPPSLRGSTPRTAPLSFFSSSALLSGVKILLQEKQLTLDEVEAHIVNVFSSGEEKSTEEEKKLKERAIQHLNDRFKDGTLVSLLNIIKEENNSTPSAPTLRVRLDRDGGDN